MTDPYSLLGVSRTATDAEIKSAYRKLALQWHPDKNPGNAEAEAKFKDINAAYELIKDADKRQQFDRGGMGGQQRRHTNDFDFDFGFGPAGFGFGPGGIDINDIFRQMHAQQRPQRNQDYAVQTTISLQDAMNGMEMNLNVQTPNGPRNVILTIPAGIENGTKMRVAGAGDRINANLPPGDLIVQVMIRPHHIFTRVAQNLVMEYPVDAIDAILGAQFEVETLDGKRVRVEAPPGVQSGQKLRVQGHGMPVQGMMNMRGDLIVAVNIMVPNDLTAEQYDALRRVQEMRGRPVAPT